MPDFDPSLCFLFDNGSLRAASTLSLRRIARRLQDDMAVAVRPVSLLHSSGVDPTGLDGQAAELLEPALNAFAEAGGRQALLLPLFFGPSAALVDYVPERIRAIQEKHPLLDTRLAPGLIQLEDDSGAVLAADIAGQVDHVIATEPLTVPRVILVDHGSPRLAVTEVRNHVAAALAQQLGDRVNGVTAASMERRAGADYDFNEPLLETALKQAIEQDGAREVVIALQFLQQGRHAGPAGDITQICAGVLASHPDVKLHITPTLAEGEAVLALLKRRWREALRN